MLNIFRRDSIWRCLERVSLVSAKVTSEDSQEMQEMQEMIGPMIGISEVLTGATTDP